MTNFERLMTLRKVDRMVFFRQIIYELLDRTWSEFEKETEHDNTITKFQYIETIKNKNERKKYFDRIFFNIMNETWNEFEAEYELEKWVPVPVEKFKDLYEVSNYGRVRSLDRVIPNPSVKSGFQKRAGKVLKGYPNTKGYLTVVLYNDGARESHMIHRLVALAFIPNPENKPEVNHKNGNKLKNFIDNLEWNTSKENSEHALRFELIQKGSKKNRKKAENHIHKYNI